MSAKRQATTELNHDNWDQEDEEPEETEGFKIASKEVLEKRVIRTAKRRSNVTNNEGQKSVFSGFGGFNKTQKSSFDFLANLTNGNKTTNTPVSSQEGPSSLFSSKMFSNQSTALFTPSDMSNKSTNTSMSKQDGTSSLFTSKPVTNQSTGLFTPSDMPKPVPSLFEKPIVQTTSSLTTPPVTQNKTDFKTSENPFKVQTNSTPINNFNFSMKSNSGNPISSLSKTPNNVFGGLTENNSVKMLPSNSISASLNNNRPSNEESDKNEKKNAESRYITIKCDKNKVDEKTLKYIKYLAGLNISVSDWIKKNIDESPVCILSPIFKDYEKHLKEIQDEYFNRNGAQGDFEQNLKSDDKVSAAVPVPKVGSQTPVTSHASTIQVQDKKVSNTIFGTPTSTNTPQATDVGSPFGNVSKVPSPMTSLSSAQNSKLGFSYGSTIAASTTTTSSGGFTFALNTSPQTTSLFATKPNVSNTNGSSQFSFGAGTPFSFNSNIQRKDENKEESNGKEDEDEPPKVEYTPLVEENSVFDKKCKVFVKKDGNFVDKGVGTLYIKKIEDSGKHQLLVRANTTLGNIVLNLILGSSIPTQRMGKNNVMLVCIPTPDAKPPPTPVLIRVKTSNEADELLEKLNKYKE